MSSPELEIRLARAAFNRALAEADLAAIGPLLGPNVVLVAGTDSALIAGRKVQMLAWKSEFTARERVIYTRTPETVMVSSVGPIAFEHGSWRGTSASDGKMLASGAYTAKWRQVDGNWVTEAELYLTLS